MTKTAGTEGTGAADPPATRRVRRAALLLVALVVLIEFVCCLSLGFSGDDFELLALARIGGLSPLALLVPHRGVFLKPIMNLVWAVLAGLFGERAPLWYAVCLAVHVLNAVLLGLFARELSREWLRKSEAPSSGSPRFVDVVFGFVVSLTWAVHDRLAEPLFSIASLNHSLTFTFYLAALLTWLRALRTGRSRHQLFAGLVLLLSLFSYEVGVSVFPAAALLLLLAPREAVQGRARTLVAILGSITLGYGLVQLCVRAAAGSGAYYRPSAALALANCGEAALAFLHIASSWIPRGALAAIGLGVLVLLAGAALFARDRLVRFGSGWALAALLPIALIPELSDRYHYIVFAGMAVACGRIVLWAWRARGRALRAVAAGAVAAHLVWSFAGSAEQFRFYHFKAALPGSILRSARAMLEGFEASSAASPAASPALFVLAWLDEPDFAANRIAAFEANRRWPWLGETTHPVYIRPAAVLGSVYPRDLLHVAGIPHHRYYRDAKPIAAARAISQGQFMVMPFVPGQTVAAPGAAPGGGASADLGAWIAGALQRSLAEGQLPIQVQAPSLSSPLRLAYLEPTDRAGAFAAEYRPETNLP